MIRGLKKVFKEMFEPKTEIQKLQKYLTHFHFVRHRFYICWPGIEPVPLQWKGFI